MPPYEESFVVSDKSWTELLNHARYWRSLSRKQMSTSLHHFSLFVDESGTERLLALGGTGHALQQVLYTIPLTRLALFTSSSILTLTPFLECAARKEGPLPAELAALCERQRTPLSNGIAYYQYDPTTSSLIYSDSSQLYVVQGKDRRKIDDAIEGCPLNAEICPADNDYVAFHANSNVHIDWGGRVIYSTTSGKHVSNGSASFVVQEELDRFTGMWWSPGPHTMLVYERVDESNVVDLQFTCPGRLPSAPMKYPLAGTPNAFSTLYLININGSKVTDEKLAVDLKELYPWYEYLSRVGWLPDGTAVWAILLSRLQDEFALILIPTQVFGPNTCYCKAGITTLMHQQRKIWFNVDNLTLFLDSDPQSLKFITSTDKQDFKHLLLCTAKIDEKGNAICVDRALTAGDWSVLRESQLYVDKRRRHVYFSANKHTPPDSNLCVTSYGQSTDVKILSEIGVSYRTEPNGLSLVPNIGFVCWQSSVREPPRCVFYRLQHSDSEPLPVAVLQHILQLPTPSILTEKQLLHQDEFVDQEFPELIEYNSANSSKKHYALLLRPYGAKKGIRHPVIQFVYGGPGVQYVRNSWAMWTSFRKFASLGYAVVVVDGRGSANRGISFEAEIKDRLGTVEIEDQIEGLMEVAKRTDGLLDLKRVAVMGWSYGGYMSLMCLAKQPNIYKAAIVGGAVTCWDLYDTAYTERYLGQPSETIYKAASVITYVNQLPNEIDRLLIVHGLIDENVHFTHTERLIEALTSAGKPYQLQIFPSERHGVRSLDAGEFHDASVLLFLSRALNAKHVVPAAAAPSGSQ